MSLESDNTSSPRLTAAEDAELRQLTWFARVGQLSEASSTRLAELRARDRRDQVRDVRPDPVSRDGDHVGTKLDSEPVQTVMCQNCGCRIARATAAASTCPNCGVSMPRHFDERLPV